MLSQVQWISQGAMLLGEGLVLYVTLKETPSKYSAYTFGGLSSPLAFGRTRTLGDIMRRHGQVVFPITGDRLAYVYLA